MIAFMPLKVMGGPKDFCFFRSSDLQLNVEFQQFYSRVAKAVADKQEFWPVQVPDVPTSLPKSACRKGQYFYVLLLHRLIKEGQYWIVVRPFQIWRCQYSQGTRIHFR